MCYILRKDFTRKNILSGNFLCIFRPRKLKCGKKIRFYVILWNQVPLEEGGCEPQVVCEPQVIWSPLPLTKYLRTQLAPCQLTQPNDFWGDLLSGDDDDELANNDEQQSVILDNELASYKAEAQIKG